MNKEKKTSMTFRLLKRLHLIENKAYIFEFAYKAPSASCHLAYLGRVIKSVEPEE